MKTSRRTVAAVTVIGALGLSLLNAPTAQAADTGITVSDIVVNKGRPIVVGTSKVVQPSVSFKIDLPPGYGTDDASRYSTDPFLYHSDIRRAAETGDNYIGAASYTCYELGPQRARCEGRLHIDPHPSQEHVDSNGDARTWKTAFLLQLWKANGNLKAEELETKSVTARLQRAAKVTANASPEPVARGRAITVTGKLTRADWNTKKYGPYADRKVSLQFRANGTDTFKTVKKATTSRTGALRTTVTASVDGSYRWVYYGNSTTGVATSAADHVDVR
ncbi:hypothetical protein JNUCC64_20875 [Streptomyces sp. JNUCC 64]